MVVRTDGEECDFGQRNGKVGRAQGSRGCRVSSGSGFFLFFLGLDADCWRSLLVGVV